MHKHITQNLLKKYKKIFFVMGPTCSDKTDIVIKLAKKYPLDIISLDSSMIYCYMNIGTGKPSTINLNTIPHQFINICNPNNLYSLIDFYHDIIFSIYVSLNNKRIPFLVGGSIMYFNILQYGISKSISKNNIVYSLLKKEVSLYGWKYLYNKLKLLNKNILFGHHDLYRIEKNINNHYIFGGIGSKTFIVKNKMFHNLTLIKLVISSFNKVLLYKKIEERFYYMMIKGFMKENQFLFTEYKTNLNMTSMHSIGYRDAWLYLNGDISFKTMIRNIIISTKRLANKQIFFIQKQDDIFYFNPYSFNIFSKIEARFFF